MSKKVFSYTLGEGQVTFAFFKKEEADALFSLLKNSNIEKVVDNSELTSYAVGRHIDGSNSVIATVKYNPFTKTASVVEIETMPKIRSNQKMRALLAKYKLFD